jgi:DNA-binding HxlR family transcriptional regulator
VDWTLLVRHRWMIPLLAELERLDGAKFVTLVHAVDASRSAVREALDALIELELAGENPGYGHLLRPEYILTDHGRPIAAACLDLMNAVQLVGGSDESYRKWSLPIVSRLAAGADRFGELRGDLDGVTPRALSQALKRLVNTGLVERAVDDTYPPVSRYRLTEASVVLVGPLDRLVTAAAAARRNAAAS